MELEEDLQDKNIDLNFAEMKEFENNVKYYYAEDEDYIECYTGDGQDRIYIKYKLTTILATAVVFAIFIVLLLLTFSWEQWIGNRKIMRTA